MRFLNTRSDPRLHAETVDAMPGSLTRHAKVRDTFSDFLPTAKGFRINISREELTAFALGPKGTKMTEPGNLPRRRALNVLT